ncbi:sarcosine oxidase subunit alpha [Sphingomonas oleivorans]|uniref:Sarcosine oxidase subunit alpha n=1 Tax=Sphingomonas oleivorans TaxID=1735121 RepID=A0A2T5G0R0_9SPHN|nr:sarcosine oxidase subunit alpha family protein [Sphingomonas oleivorans]PTQ12728.1 sarcosine oxidase subunit alpha [Sphingomonas oleivorans]
MSRLAAGGLIDRSQPLRFRFDGRDYGGFAGDTLASALIANDVRLVGRSFKYHRPRGLLTAGAEEPNALVTLRAGARAEPNSRATTIELYDGLEAKSQNRWPSLGFDLMAVNGLMSPLFVAGFYYKTFMWPAALWEKLYEPLIRRAAGLGALSGAPDPDHYDKAHGFCDLLVIGAGPAGLAAALAAGRAGARVFLLEQENELGGRLLSERHEIDGRPGHLWAREVADELSALPEVTILRRTTAFGVYDDRSYGAIERVADHLAEPLPGQPRQRLWKIVAKRTILAAGAIERPILFGGNDRPGVMMASAVQSYVNRFAAVPGRRIALFTTSDSGWQVAADLRAAGVEVAALIDPREGAAPMALPDVPLFAGGTVTSTHGRILRSIGVRAAGGRVTRIAADVLAMAGGWNPAMGIGCNLGSRPIWSEAIHSFVLKAPPPGMALAGAAAGRFSLAETIGDGLREGMAAAADMGHEGHAPPMPRTSDDKAGVAAPWHVPGGRGKAFVDFQHDVTDSDIALSVREGFRSVEHLKRYTTLGMATDQGKTSQVNAHALLAMYSGKAIVEAGTVLSRPPYLPVAIGAFAGHHRDADFRPVRLTAGHGWAVEQGARFVDAGQWKRAQWFARPGETGWLETVSREARAVRSGVGLCDVSTLGKIELSGADAGVLLDRLYINNFSTLKVGRARYGVMLREDGIVMDDGTTTRLAEDRYFLTTTTANAARVMQHIDYCRQILWPELDVQAVSVTEQWAQYAVAGPLSRRLLQYLLPDLDLSNEAFPFMAAAETRWRGVPMRIFRLSFSGELAYELGVPAAYGDALVRALMEAGRPLDATPYGTEALGVLRIEKGHAAGNELNGQTTAADLGFGGMMSTKKDYIGRVMAARPGLTDPDRPVLIGIRPVDRVSRLAGGAHLLPTGVPDIAAHDEGHVTSVAFSPMMDGWIGLALLRRGRERIGEHVRAVDLLRGTDVEVEICSPVFVDPEGVRLRG